jgi:hypothetical protein
MEGSILVADAGNYAVRRVTMAVSESTVAGGGRDGCADGEGAAAHFKCPTDVVVDKEGTIVVADRYNNRLRKIVGRQVTTLAGGSEAGTADGVGAGARFNQREGSGQQEIALGEVSAGAFRMQEGSGQQEIALGEVSAGAFRVVLWYLRYPRRRCRRGRSCRARGRAQRGVGRRRAVMAGAGKGTVMAEEEARVGARARARRRRAARTTRVRDAQRWSWRC